MSTKLRRISEIQRAALSRSVRARATDFLAALGKLESHRNDLIYPTKRKGVIEWLIGHPIEDEHNDVRRLQLERAAFAHDERALHEIATEINAKVEELERTAPSILRDFTESLIRELEAEFVRVRETLLPAFTAAEAASALPDSPDAAEKHAVRNAWDTPRPDVALPLLFWTRHLRNARAAIATGWPIQRAEAMRATFEPLLTS